MSENIDGGAMLVAEALRSSLRHIEDALGSGRATKRELFAAMALQGMLSGSGSWDKVYDEIETEEDPAQFYARMAVEHADELLRALTEL